MTMTLIESKTLTSAASSIEFINIPQDGTDLVALVSARTTASRGAGGWAIQIGINNSYSNFTERELRGNGSSASTFTSSAVYAVGASNDATANTFGNSSVYIPNYTGSTNKSISVDGVEENNATEAISRITAGLWSQTSAITSMSFLAISPSVFSIGSTISLYKVVKGTDGIVTTS
jgi:hypothetical protein